MERDEDEVARDALLGDNDDDLEFHITFPSPVLAKCNSSASSVSSSDSPEPGAAGDADFVLVPPLLGGQPEPVVFLLGWAGCTDKHLAKYSQLYEACGCITLRYTAPAEYLFFDVTKIRPLARKLLDLLAEMSLEANAVFFHLFSNNGATVYQYMVEALRTPEYEHIVPRIRGRVFDSGPGRRTHSSFLKATSQAFLDQQRHQRQESSTSTDLGGARSGAAPSSGGGLGFGQPHFCFDFIRDQEQDLSDVPALFMARTITQQTARAEAISKGGSIEGLCALLLYMQSTFVALTFYSHSQVLSNIGTKLNFIVPLPLC